MKLSIQTELDYFFGQPTDVLVQIEAAMIPEQRVERAHIELPQVEHFARLPGHDSIGDRIWLRVEGQVVIRYQGVVEPNRLTGDVASLDHTPPHLLPAETIDYMMPSRYCPSDEFQSLVESEFGQFQGGARVMAMRDWIADHVAYTPGSSNASTDAMATYVSRNGVCRDFAHLLVTMVRASAIPARFVSCYGPNVTPQDFHAICEVFLGDTWYALDATGMATADEIVKIGVGRDAADVSFLTSYGFAQLNSQTVSVETC